MKRVKPKANQKLEEQAFKNIKHHFLPLASYQSGDPGEQNNKGQDDFHYLLLVLGSTRR